jgi:hypothetical protein
MKKLLVLMLVLGLASAASATVMDVVPVDVGLSAGRLGGMDDALEAGDVIGLKIVLNSNPYPGTTYPSYDGYILSSMDLSLDIVGNGSLDAGTYGKTGPQWKYNANLSPFGVVDDGDISNGLDQISGVALTPVQPPLTGSVGPVDVMWDLLLECTGGGDVLVDLGINGVTQYAVWSDATGAGPSVIPLSEYLDATDNDLGDLVVHQVPEPMTIALLGLGGLLLRRRK